MSKGENIFKRKDGRWEARYVRCRESSGKIHYGYCYGKTYKEAKEKVLECKAQRLELPVKKEKKMSDYCDEWLNSKKTQIKESTYVKYKTAVELHIKAALGDFCPEDMSDELAEKFRDEMLGKGLSPKTVRDVLSILRAIICYATRSSGCGTPIIEIRYPRETKREMRILTSKEQKQLTEYLLTDIDACKFGILMALHTGMRIGEMCALTWDNILLDDEMILVTSTMQRLKNFEEGEEKTRIRIADPKSSNSVRWIPMSRFLTELCRDMKPEYHSAYVLTGTNRYMEPRTLQYRLKRYTDACSLEGVHFHTLRHTFATRCVEVGFELKSLSEILGHATTNITLDRYVHPSYLMKKENIKKLEAIGM